jgi:hypothetical protein
VTGRWSSVRVRLGGRGGLLASLPVPLPERWLERLDAPETPAEIAACRGHPEPQPAASGQERHGQQGLARIIHQAAVGAA